MKRLLLAACLTLALGFGITATGQYEKRMADIDVPTQAGQWLYFLGSTDDDVAGVLPPDVDGRVVVLFRYNVNTNRLQILESTGDYREIPSASVTGYAAITSDALLTIDSNGNLTTTAAAGLGVLNPVIAMGSTPTSVQWPQGASLKTGQAVVVGSIGTGEVDALSAPIDRAQLSLRTVEQRVSKVETIDPNNGADQNIFSNSFSEDFITTRVVASMVSTSDTLATGEFDLRTLAADDVVKQDAYPEISGSKDTIIYPKRGSQRVLPTQHLYVHFDVLEGSTKLMRFEVFGYWR